MNQGAAKAYRRHCRATGKTQIVKINGEDVTVPPDRLPSGRLAPGRAVKALWASANHKERGQMRKKFRTNLAQIRRDSEHQRDSVQRAILMAGGK